jgi:DNA-binding CsgD family transcriptional regulator
MEGGVIMDNTAYYLGGGFLTGSRGTFKKTGGIIYGSDAPDGYRNIALDGGGTPKTYGHAVVVAIFDPAYQFRDDTVGENDNLSYQGVARGNGTFGEGEKWDNPNKAFWRMLIAVILPVLALGVGVFLVYRKITLKKMMKIAREAKETASGNIFKNVKLTDREKEVGVLLLSELSMTQIAVVMHIAYTTADYHVKKLYRKMGVQSRTELLVRVKNEKGKMKNEEI